MHKKAGKIGQRRREGSTARTGSTKGQRGKRGRIDRKAARRQERQWLA